jgi:TolB-like protein/DNA-binding winged helix-turn-helix (wHTH) protein/Flp pilus assembly protein TadD
VKCREKRLGVASECRMSAGTVYEFGEFVLDPARRSLLRRDGSEAVISAKAFDALLCLVEHAGEVVPRAALAQALWPTTIVEDNNLSQTVAALRRALGDDSEKPRYVVTVPRRGYQLVAAVRARESASAPSSSSARSLPSAERPRGRAALWLTVGCAAAVVFTTGAWLVTKNPTAGTGAVEHAVLPRSVAVLPCQNLSPRSEDDYFAAGIHEEVLDHLARIRDVNVIASTSVQRYAGGTTPIPTIAAELNVGAVVECSVRFAADRVRVSARLIDGRTGGETWSDVYDAPFGDVFAIQDEIATMIAAALESTLPRQQNPVAPPTESVAAYAAYLKAISLYRTNGGIGVGVAKPVRAAILSLLSQALALDPNFSAALAWRGNVNVDALLFDAWDEAERDIRVAELMGAVEGDARRALELDTQQGMAHVVLARLDMYRWRLAEARAMLDRALALAPNDSVVAHYSAMIDLLRGEPASAVQAARRALVLDPKNPAPYGPLAMGLRALGDIDGSIGAYETMVDVAPTAAIGYVSLARTLTARGDDARILQTLGVAEQFLAELRSFRLDAAMSYAHLGAHADAARLVDDFMQRTEGQRLDPSLAAMAALAVGDYERAAAAVRAAIAARASGMDPVPLEQIRQNTWSDPALDSAEWRELRAALAYRAFE